MKPTFRNAMLGFHKEDVFHFITKQNKQFETRLHELAEEKAALENRLNQEKEELAEKCRRLEETLGNGDLYVEKLASIRQRSAVLLSDLEGLRACYGKCDEALASSKTQYHEMKKKADQAAIFQEKAEKLDALSGVLTSIWGGEKKGADEKREEAETAMEEFPLDPVFTELSQLISALEEHLTELDRDAAEVQ